MGLSLRGQTSGAVDINAPAVAGDNTITLPNGNGSINQFYKNSTTAGIVTHSSMVENEFGNVGIGTDDPGVKLSVWAGESVTDRDVFQVRSKTGAFNIQVSDSDAANPEWSLRTYANEPIVFKQGTAERLRITSTGGVGINTTTVAAGVNVAVGGTVRVIDTADAAQYLTITHQGINFQNTGAGSSDTATTHLLDDYEEGTWTPSYQPQTNSFDSITYDATIAAKYQKIGNTVYVQGFLRTDALTVGTASGFIFIGGLPFTPHNQAGHNHVISLGSVQSWSNDPDAAMTTSGNRFALYYRTTANGGTSVLEVSDMNTGVNDNQVYFSGHYSIN